MSFMKTTIVASILAMGLFAQIPTAPKRVAIKAAHLLDGKTDKAIDHAVVLIEGERIKAIGSNLAIPEGTEVIDLGGATLLPGLIDCHTHLLMELEAKADYTEAIAEYVAKHGTGERALFGAAKAREMLEAGFTAVRDLGNSGANGDVALRDAINAKWVAGPRMRVSTRAISAIGGQFPRMTRETGGLVSLEYAEVTGVEEAKKAVRQAVADGADLIKVIVDQRVKGGIHALDLAEVKAIVAEAHRLKRKVAAHVMLEEAVTIAIEAGVDSIEHASGITEASLAAMAKRGIFMVPTDFTLDSMKPFYKTDAEWAASVEGLKEEMHENAERLLLAKRLGVRIAAGSDMTIALPGRTRGEASKDVLAAYAGAGMKAVDILRAVTIDAADLLGWADKIGSLEAGKFADIIAVPGDPAKDIKELDHVSFVMKDGVVVKGGGNR